jgi:hypothetical protein
MIARRSIAQRFFPTISVPDYLELRGLLLSHFVGFALAVPFLLNRVIQQSLPFTKPVDLPLYLVALWLVLDKRGRLGHLRPIVWDWLYIGFVALQAFAHIYADLDLQRLSGFSGYIDWSIGTLRPYLYYLVVREVMNRRGAQPHVILYWFVGAVTMSGIIGMLQAKGLFGVREWAYRFYHQYQVDISLGYSSPAHFARGAAAHPNNLAYHLWLGLSCLVGVAWYRGVRLMDLLLAAVMIPALFFTYSRSGIITLTAICIAFVIFLMARRRFAAAASATVVFGVLAFIGVSAVFAFNIQRYKPILAGEGQVKSMEELGTYRMRLEGASKALTVGELSPVFGVQAVGAGINNSFQRTKSVYSFEGKNDNMYSLMFVFHGVIGLVFLGGLIYATLRVISKKYWNHAFAAALFVAGVGFVMHGNTENLVFFDAMYVINVLMALVVSGIRPLNVEEGQGSGFIGMLGRRIKSFT